MIRTISSSTIQPVRLDGGDDQDQLTENKIVLGPSDVVLLLHDYIQRGLIFHKPLPTTTLSLVNLLKSAFSQTINIFYPLAGRLISIDNDDDETKSFFIDCNGAGAEFVYATADGKITTADILEPVTIPEELICSLFTMNRVTNYEAAVSSLPLVSVQVTELADAIFVACSLNHCIADGTFFWRFFSTWSEIARAGDGFNFSAEALREKRVFSRGFLDGIADLPIHLPKRCFVATNSSERPNPEKLQRRMFRFSEAKVAELKIRANAEANSTGANCHISSLQAVLAHLWIAVTRSWGIASGETVTYMVAMGLRQRLGADINLPDEYLGNMARMAVAKSTAGEVVEGGLGAAALLINKAVASQTASVLRNQLKVSALALADKFSIYPLPLVGKLPANILLTGSSPRFDVYGCDFGWGKPLAVRSCPASHTDNGKLTVFPGPQQGSLDFEVYLSAHVLRALDSDPDFVSTLS